VQFDGKPVVVNKWGAVYRKDGANWSPLTNSSDALDFTIGYTSGRDDIWKVTKAGLKT